MLLSKPKVAAWLEQNLTGSNVVDIKVVHLQFGLALREVEALFRQISGVMKAACTPFQKSGN